MTTGTRASPVVTALCELPTYVMSQDIPDRANPQGSPCLVVWGW